MKWAGTSRGPASEILSDSVVNPNQTECTGFPWQGVPKDSVENAGVSDSQPGNISASHWPRQWTGKSLTLWKASDAKTSHASGQRLPIRQSCLCLTMNITIFVLLPFPFCATAILCCYHVVMCCCHAVFSYVSLYAVLWWVSCRDVFCPTFIFY